MLRSIDVLIGLSTVMLVLSLVVTALTHALLELAGVRSRHLRAGIVALFHEIGWNFDASTAEKIAGAIVQPPWGAKGDGPKRDAITREELVEGLISLAHRANAEKAYQPLADQVKALAPGIDPAAMIASVRRIAVEIGTEHPELSAAAAKSMALIRGNTAELAAPIFGAFDPAMGLASARFTSWSRTLVAVIAVAVAAAIPVDAFDVMNRFAGSTGPVMLPPGADHASWAGVAVTAVLLSLGAPFWFDVLKDTLRLRSAVAEQEERDRVARQSASGPVSGGMEARGQR